MKINGTVQVVYEKTTKFGKRYSICVDVDGDEIWYGCDKTKPDLEKGQVISFKAEKSAKGYWEADVGSIKVDSNAPAPKTKSGGSGWNSPERQKSITAQSSITSAIAFATLAFEVGALSLGAKNASAPKKFDALEEIIKRKATEFYMAANDPDSYYGDLEDLAAEDEEEDDDFNPVPD